jgi:methyl-accepting chemotaxis protein
MFRFAAMPMARKLNLLVGGAMLGFLVLLGLAIFDERRAILSERENAVKQTVELAHAVIVEAHQRVQSGQLGEADAKAQALATLRQMRYAGNEYFWVNDMHPRMVMHPIKAELEGKDLSGVKDPSGQNLFVTFVNVVKQQGEGFVAYGWPKPGSEDPVQKVSYVKGFAPWGWIVGSGVYIDTVNATLINHASVLAGGALIMGARSWRWACPSCAASSSRSGESRRSQPTWRVASPMATCAPRSS